MNGVSSNSRRPEKSSSLDQFARTSPGSSDAHSTYGRNFAEIGMRGLRNSFGNYSRPGFKQSEISTSVFNKLQAAELGQAPRLHTIGQTIVDDHLADSLTFLQSNPMARLTAPLHTQHPKISLLPPSTRPQHTYNLSPRFLYTSMTPAKRSYFKSGTVD